MFAIQFVSNGVTKYSTAKCNCYLDEDILKAHQFQNEAAAIRVVKRFRLDGREDGGLFTIIKVRIVPEAEIHIPHPKPKSGFVITRVVNGVKKYYLGAKQPVKTLGDSVVIDAWGTVQRTTTFKTEAQARQKQAEMTAFANNRIDYHTVQRNKANSNGYTSRQSQRHVDAFTEKLAMVQGSVVELI